MNGMIVEVRTSRTEGSRTSEGGQLGHLVVVEFFPESVVGIVVENLKWGGELYESGDFMQLDYDDIHAMPTPTEAPPAPPGTMAASRLGVMRDGPIR